MSKQQKLEKLLRELDVWSDAHVISPLSDLYTGTDEWEDAVYRVKQAVRAKVLKTCARDASFTPAEIESALLL